MRVRSKCGGSSAPPSGPAQPAPAGSGPARQRPVGVPGLEFVESRPLGGAWVLDGLWHVLGIDAVMRRLLAGTRRDAATERVLFALVANRALAPSSKLAAASWVSNDVHVPGLESVGEDACYRAMDWLLAVEDTLAKSVYDVVADLLNLEVDLLFFDTTSTYFQIQDADTAVWRDATGQQVEPPATDTATGAAVGKSETPEALRQAGFRTWGKSKDHRDDLPQVVVGMAVTRDGIPIRVWSWPGNTSDSVLIRQAKDDLRDWTLGKVVWVADRGFTSEANRRHLAAGGHGYILGEKLRSGTAEAAAALARPGRYQQVADNLRVKEVKVSDHERFVVCHNPDAAERDATIREQMLAKLTELIDGSDSLSARKRAELGGVISTKPALNRYLRTTPGGLLRIDHAAVAAEAKLDGKYLLRTSDPHLTAGDIAQGYKQLIAIEKAWRDMKQIIDLRPVYHRLEDRIRAHILLCWLALLLIRIIEIRTGSTWHHLRPELQRLHVGTFTGPAGTYRQTTTLSDEVKRVLTALDLPAPPKILHLDTHPATG
jgi:Transposase DDE domain